jgi:hypothetical protein
MSPIKDEFRRFLQSRTAEIVAGMFPDDLVPVPVVVIDTVSDVFLNAINEYDRGILQAIAVACGVPARELGVDFGVDPPTVVVQ